MKNISLELCFSPKQKYLIHLGNVEFLEFKSKKFALSFLNKYKLLLTDNVRYLIQFQKEVNSLHKDFFFDFDNFTSKQIFDNLHSFDNRLEYVFARFSEGNANAMVLSNIEFCFACLIDSLDLIFDFSKRYKNYSLKNISRSKIKILFNLEKMYESDKYSLQVNFDYRQIKNKLINLNNKTA